MIQQLIDRYKRFRTKRLLSKAYQYSYAFVGMGQHSMTNLYPVLHYLGVPMKYICVTSKQKALLIESKIPHIIATTSIDDILGDDTVKGIFVSASPEAHFSIASRILKTGKSLFIEKPPCKTLNQLDTLINLQNLYGSPIAMVGLQKQYAPAMKILRKRLGKEQLINYDIHYLTGAYPEGNVLLDLFIHPHIVGTLELSTAYTWANAEESIKVSTTRGIYHLSQMDELTFVAHSSTLFGLPIEKVHSRNKTVEYLYARNNYIPTFPNNQIYSQGYFNELQNFVDAVEGHKDSVDSSLQSLRDVYALLENIKTAD